LKAAWSILRHVADQLPELFIVEGDAKVAALQLSDYSLVETLLAAFADGDLKLRSFIWP
jgi:hypothetical protein